MTRDTEPAGTREWSDMTEWVVESVSDKPVGFVFDLGPRDYGPAEEEEGIEAVCAQVVILQDDVLMLRRSRIVLHRLNLGDHSVDDLPLEEWLDGEHFEDCTDGYFFTQDVDLVADAVTSWFRDCGLVSTPEDLGCSYEFPDSLLPEESEE